MRLGRFSERAVEPGNRIVFSLEASGAALPLPHPEVFRAVNPGDTLSADDDRLRFRVLSAEIGTMEVEALRPGILRPRKGLNLLEHPVELESLTRIDAELCQTVGAGRQIAVAFSFMRDGREAEWLRRRAPGRKVVGKVERREAIDAIEAIASRTDAIWVCRVTWISSSAWAARPVGGRVPSPAAQATCADGRPGLREPLPAPGCHPLRGLSPPRPVGPRLRGDRALRRDGHRSESGRAVAVASELLRAFLD